MGDQARRGNLRPLYGHLPLKGEDMGDQARRGNLRPLRGHLPLKGRDFVMVP